MRKHLPGTHVPLWKAMLPILMLLLFTCRHKPDVEAEKIAILLLHEEQRKAHLEKDAALLVSQASPDFMVLNRGNVERPGSAASIKKFQTYFDAVDFIRWDDVSEPIFSFSADGTMATTIVEKLVITRQKLESDRLDTTRFAWLAVYRKNKGKWQMDRMVSTQQ